jgi:hypothetical protein
MTPSGDYVHEMPTLHEIDDATAEAILTGRAVSPELAGFMQALNRTASRPVAPSDELAERMARGDFGRSAGAHRLAAHRPQGRGIGTAARAWTRTGVRVLAAVPRSFSGARQSVKLGAIVALVAVPVLGLSGIGFAGALPDPVQERFEGLVESVTPYEFPARPAEDRSGFGDRVSEDAKDGGVDGPEISEEAREKNQGQNEERRPVDPEPAVDPEPGVPATPGPPDHVGELPDNRSTDHPGPDARPEQP